MDVNKIYQGDCLEIMKRIPDGTIDMILCDLPYGQTKNKWDSIIPLDILWNQYIRIVKPRGAIVLFAQGMFTAMLMMSNRIMWRYNLVWSKIRITGFLNANRMPLRAHEDICIFYKKQPIYNPQKFVGEINHSRGRRKNTKNNNYGHYGFKNSNASNMKYPRSILEFEKVSPSKIVHPTEKPVSLCEWLIRTYTDAGNLVLDNCIGSGTTAVACIKTRRKYIGIELNPEYIKIAERRVLQPSLL